jgi:hypothetical protein
MLTASTNKSKAPWKIITEQVMHPKRNLFHQNFSLICGNLPQCQTDGLNSFSASAKQISLTPNEMKIKVKVTLRLIVSQSVCLGVEPHLGLMTRYLLTV